ncbi:MAG TPA: MFS transporter [Bacteroidales bacterium]|nr:MFS transporter [Bacteroidales bacterium]
MYNKKTVFWAACAGMLLFGICMITLGSVAAGIRAKLQLDELSAGTLFSILPLGILIGSLFFGPIVDKYGYKILLSVCCVLMFIGFEGIAFSPSMALMKICVFLFGIGGGAINGSTNALVADISDKDKGANLSLLGVAYGVGAIGMPLLLGLINDRLSFAVILSLVGIITVVTGLFFLIIKFPPPKQKQGFPLREGIKLVKDNILLIFAFFLFFQSGYEAIINNWTTTYLTEKGAFTQSNALFGLSSVVAGMIIMRTLNGSVLRSLPAKKLMFSSFLMLLLGLTALKTGNSFVMSVAGLVLVGAGLASGFPVMLGFVGDRYPEISGTAFSVVLFISLCGNTLLNYGMGMIAQYFGIQHLITFAFAETIIMIILFIVILRKTEDKN